MQVINPMGSERFDTVCDAGVKLVEQLKRILRASGLGQEEAANVLAMAAGGVLKSSNLEPDEFMDATYVAFQMWVQKEGTKGISGAVFDPPHKRPDFVPVARDMTSEN